MAYVSKITISSVIEREGFKTIEEVKNYFKEKYPNLVLDENVLKSYFPSAEIAELVSSQKEDLFSKNNRSVKKRNLLLLSEYLQHDFTYLELISYFKEKYPDIYLTISIVRKALDFRKYPDNIAMKIKDKHQQVRKKSDAKRGKKIKVSFDFPYAYLLNVDVEELTSFELKRIKCAHLYLQGYTYLEIAQEMGIDKSTVSYYFQSDKFLSICKDTYVQEIKYIREKMKYNQSNKTL